MTQVGEIKPCGCWWSKTYVECDTLRDVSEYQCVQCWRKRWGDWVPVNFLRDSEETQVPASQR